MFLELSEHSPKSSDIITFFPLMKQDRDIGAHLLTSSDIVATIWKKKATPPPKVITVHTALSDFSKKLKKHVLGAAFLRKSRFHVSEFCRFQNH